MISVGKRVLILCEDSKSSLCYLDSFKKDEKLKRELSSVSIEIYHPQNYSPLGLVQEAKDKKAKAKREKNSYTEVWVVLDKDQHHGLPSALNLAKENDIKVALSIICFEIWILLHFRKTTKAFYNGDELLKFVQEQYYPTYQKGKINFEELKDKIDTAIENGRWLCREVQNDLDRGTQIYELSSYTDFHKIVERLLNPVLFGAPI